MDTFEGFESFDPKSGPVPRQHPFQLFSIAWRARRILENVSVEEIHRIARCIADEAAAYVQRYIEEETERYIAVLCETGVGWELGYLPENQRSEQAIRDLLDNWPTDADDDHPLLGLGEDILVIDTIRPDDPKKYAVLALCKVSEVLAAWGDNGPPRPMRHKHHPGTILVAAESAVEAMDAVATAEKLSHVSRLRSASAARAAHAKNKENRAMKAEVWAWCAEHLDNFPSVDAAAESLAGTFTPVKFRTVQNWIAQYRKMQAARQTVRPAP